MIARHITMHDEHGARLIGIDRAIYRTPLHSALDALAMELAARGSCDAYSQRHIPQGVVLSKTYPFEGRTIVNSVYFDSNDALRALYERDPLGDALFLEDESLLVNAKPYALAAPDISALKSAAAPGSLAAAVRALFPDEGILSEIICAMRTGRFPLAIIGGATAGELSRQLAMALELMLRALPGDAALKMDYSTVAPSQPLNGVNGYTMGEYDRSCSAYIYLRDSTRDLNVEPSSGDIARARALLKGDYAGVAAARSAPDDKAAPARGDGGAHADQRLSQQDLDYALNVLSASLKYANSREFRNFTRSFTRLRRTLGSDMYFRYALAYCDFLHRLNHQMHELYDAELASLYNDPPAGLLSSQIARTIGRYPGALHGTLAQIERTGSLDKFVMEFMPALGDIKLIDEYPSKLLAARNALMDCLPPGAGELAARAMAEAANREIAAAASAVTAELMLSVRDALGALMSEEPRLSEVAFDPLLSELIERLNFDELDEYDERTYDALDYAYSYVRQWDGLVTDNQRAVCLLGRLFGGYAEWGGSVMQGALELIQPMEPRRRDAFMQFVRRYFCALCDGGLERAQMSESVVVLTTLAALRFDSEGKWNLSELDDVLDRLDASGDSLEREYWQQISTRVDLMPMAMVDEAFGVAGERAEQALRARPVQPREASRRRPQPEIEPEAQDSPERGDPRRPHKRAARDERTRNRTGERQFNRPDDEARYRAHSRAYDARAAERTSGRGEREGDGGRARRTRKYEYESDDDDGQDRLPLSGRSFEDMLSRYRSDPYVARRRAGDIDGNTLALAATLVLFASATAFCFIRYVL